MAGRKTKDKVITDNFNIEKKGLSRRALAAAKRQAKEEAADDRSANQMLSDMRWVYQKVKGRARLKDLIESDDKQFVFMVKELMKIEAAKILRSKDDGTVNQSVFVILKGLAEEKQYEVEDPLVNVKQIQHVIQPEAGKFEPEKEEEKVEVVL